MAAKRKSAPKKKKATTRKTSKPGPIPDEVHLKICRDGIIANQKRRDVIVELMEAGLSQRGAYHMFNREYDKIYSDDVASTKYIRQWLLEELQDALVRAKYAEKGPNAVAPIADRIAKMIGADAPERKSVNISVSGAMSPQDKAQMLADLVKTHGLPDDLAGE